ncbi:ribonuclease Z, partial [Lactobacillus delbrueckii subsp. lactis]|nr:ribonuclease Z [Lactobacillus delbrueckii subsp. lactis]
MELEFLGTCSGQPSKLRNVSSLALKLLDELNEIWLFDCGEEKKQKIMRTN